MSRLLLFAFLFVCLIYLFQASPVPEDTEKPATDAFDEIASKAKKWFEDTKGAISTSNLNDALENVRTYMGQAGDSIKKEIEKLASNSHS